MIFLKKGDFVISCKKEDEDFVDKINFDKIYDYAAKFYNLKEAIEIKVYFMYSLNEYYFFSNNKFENWICAFSNYPNFIFIFSQKEIEKLTVHKKEDIEGVILHELSHIIYSKLINYPNKLINEGIATYLKINFSSPQKAEKINMENFDLFDNTLNPYTEGFKLIYSLIEKMGKDKFLYFLKDMKNINSSEINSKIINILK